MRVVTALEMREIDRIAIQERGIPGLTLMENAGKAVADEIMDCFAPRRVAVVTGKGNNAGDGFVVARLLAEQGVKVIVCLLAPGSELKGDALANFKRLPERVQKIDIASADALAEQLSAPFDCVVDAILGTGVKGAVTGLFGQCIEAINACAAPVVAVDIPTGLPADGVAAGEGFAGPVVRAALTVTLGLPKLGMVIPPTCAFISELVIADIGFPADLIGGGRHPINLITAGEVAASLPARPFDGHKGTFGSALVIAGSRGMTGAAVLAGQGAQRSGTGLVFVACPEKLEPVIAALLVEPLKLPVESEDGWRFDLKSLDGLLAAAEKMDAVALGPGIGQIKATRALAAALCRDIDKPMVIDADGLNCLADQPEAVRERRAPTVLTPHPGEMARLLGVSTKEVQAGRMETARRAAKQFNCVVALKGAQTVVALPTGEVHINPTGNPGMAKGGSGDVLTGLIAGLLAQGMSAGDAARAGVFLHGLAGDIAAEESHPRAITALDVAHALGPAFAEIEEQS